VPGGLEAFGVEIKGEPGELLAWSGDFDPPLGGHGTHCASNIVGQGVSNGKLPTFDDLPGDGKYPGAVVGGRRTPRWSRSATSTSTSTSPPSSPTC
jgi:hypothetical protein